MAEDKNVVLRQITEVSSELGYSVLGAVIRVAPTTLDRIAQVIDLDRMSVAWHVIAQDDLGLIVPCDASKYVKTLRPDGSCHVSKTYEPTERGRAIFETVAGLVSKLSE